MNVPFLDLRITDGDERTQILAAVAATLDHGRLVMGPEVGQFESIVSTDTGRKYAVAVASGSEALHLSLKALGIGIGDEVITTPLSWIATTNAIVSTGAVPVFADVRDDLNINPNTILPLITSRTKAILVVHFCGRMCDMAEILQIANAHSLAVVEDCAQAYGASINGRFAGSFGQVAAFSMNPMKVYAACGEAGAIATDQQVVADRLIALRYNGCKDRETCTVTSLNGRIDTIQAAVLIVRRKSLTSIISRRKEIAAYYTRQLSSVVRTPPAYPDDSHVFYTYTILVERRDELRHFLSSNGIETKVHYETLMPDQPVYRGRYVEACANARLLSRQVLSIPIHEKLTSAQLSHVTSSIRHFYK